jgi:urease accessory protein
MKRAYAVKPVGTWQTSSAVDRVMLSADDRQRRRIMLTAENGTEFLLDLPRPTTLRHGDGLLLDDGTIVAVAGEPEALSEIVPATPSDFVRVAWHLGNRHADIQIVGDRLRIRRDHVLEDMVRSLGATVETVNAAFDPVTLGQAYSERADG